VNQNRTPLFSGLAEHANRKPIQFHIPGHKRGAWIEPEFRRFIGDNALSIDLINIAPLDDLHAPSGIIREAQELAADAFGADGTLFSVQGTSGAIMTMILSVCSPGDKIIVPRNVHKSVLTAMILAGAQPVFVAPAMDRRLGITHGIPISSLIEALNHHPDTKAVLVINPTYFGVCTDLKQIVQLTHAHNIPVLVDEAHGAHIHFHHLLPLSAMQAGADMAATSIHKLGGSLTQSSILNIQKGRIDPKRVQVIHSLLTTTSTSYILLASLDAARKQLALHGQQLLGKAIHLAQYARQKINEIPGLYCFGEEILGTEATYAFDPTKLTIHVRGLGITGYETEKWLRKTHNIEVEFSDLYNILCIITPADTQETVHRLISALRQLAAQRANQQHVERLEIKLPEIPRLAIPPREAFYADTEMVPLEKAAGRIIAEFIYMYPPGIPVLLPGEVISPKNISYIREHLKAGLPVKGPEDSSIRHVKVIKE